MGWFGGGKKRRGASTKRRPGEASRERDLQRQQREAQKQRAERRRELERQQRAQKKSAQRTQVVEKRTTKPVGKPATPPAMKMKKQRDPRAPTLWQQVTSRAMPLLALSLVGALVLGGWWMLHIVGSEPVSRVLFTGALKHVNRDELVARTQPLLVGEGFMTADLEAIRMALLALPWVAEVSVRRRWPSQLVVAVTEQEPIARWGDDGLLNRRGQVFRPQQRGEVDKLPALFGPDAAAADVVARYAELSALLADAGLRLLSLGTDQRGSWRAEVDGGVQLRLGTGELLEKLRRFTRVYRAELQPRFAEVAYVDLRYSNGLAVGWRTETSSNQSKTSAASASSALALDNSKRALGETRNG